jgi:hypothetical protein
MNSFIVPVFHQQGYNPILYFHFSVYFSGDVQNQQASCPVSIADGVQARSPTIEEQQPQHSELNTLPIETGSMTLSVQRHTSAQEHEGAHAVIASQLEEDQRLDDSVSPSTNDNITVLHSQPSSVPRYHSQAPRTQQAETVSMSRSKADKSKRQALS